jgi:hypothetical protein
MWYKNLSALLKLRSEVSKMSISELKTSEGRMHLLLQVLGIYSAIHGFIPAPLAAKLMVASAAAYAVARSLVKAAEALVKLTTNTKDDAIVAEAGALLDAADKALAPENK